MFAFLDYPGVEPTHDRAERALEQKNTPLEKLAADLLMDDAILRQVAKG